MKIAYKTSQYCQQRQQEKKRWIWPVHLAMEATYMRDRGNIVTWDDNCADADKIIYDIQGIPFLELPAADRILTKASDRKYQNNGNYKHHPGTYIQSASGCWWGKCTFCKECGAKYELRPVDYVINEIRIAKAEGYREIFDDAASFATGPWREEFCMKLMSQKIAFSCNMRFGVTEPKHYMMMKNSGFRMLLYGLESANQVTLNTINKGIRLNQAIDELKMASKMGMEPHIAVMFGYPWESDDDAIRTLQLVHRLLRKGYAKTAQASLYRTKDNNANEAHHKYVPKIYDAAYYPDFWINRLTQIKSVADIQYIWRGIKSCFGI